MTSIWPPAVIALNGGLVRLTGTDMDQTVHVEVGEEILTMSDLQWWDTGIAFQAPQAKSLGPASITAINANRTSMSINLIYMLVLFALIAVIEAGPRDSA